MAKTTLTLKIDKLKKDAVYFFCRKQGFVASKFFEKAAENEMERRLVNESVNVFENYQKQRKRAVGFDEVVKTTQAKKKSNAYCESDVGIP